VLAAMLAAGCGSSHKGSSPPANNDVTPPVKTSTSLPAGVAAVVGGLQVPTARVDNLLSQAAAVYKQGHHPFPKKGSNPYNVLLQRATGYLVAGAMYMDGAKKDGIVVTDADVTAALTAQRNTTYGGSAAKQKAAWKAQGISASEAFEEQRLTLTEERIQQKIVTGVTVTDQELQDYYSTHLSAYTTSATRAIRQILVHSMSLAKKLDTQLQKGANFATLAKKYSADPSTAVNGGATILEKGKSDPQLEAAAFAIPIGKTSTPITSADGSIRIIQATGDVQPAHQTPLSEIAPGLSRQLLDSKKRAVLAKWQLDVKNTYCGSQITYAKAYAPSTEFDPCGTNRPVPSTG
jgi:parvulin-like peptidyl-prolyl isomerase